MGSSLRHTLWTSSASNLCHLHTPHSPPAPPFFLQPFFPPFLPASFLPLPPPVSLRASSIHLFLFTPIASSPSLLCSSFLHIIRSSLILSLSLPPSPVPCCLISDFSLSSQSCHLPLFSHPSSFLKCVFHLHLISQRFSPQTPFILISSNYLLTTEMLHSSWRLIRLFSPLAPPCLAVIIAYVKALASIPLRLTGLDTFWSSTGLTPDSNAACTSPCKGSQWRLKGIHLPWHTNTGTDTCVREASLLKPHWWPVELLVSRSRAASEDGGQKGAGKTSQVWPLQSASPCVLFKSLRGAETLSLGPARSLYGSETYMPKT